MEYKNKLNKIKAVLSMEVKLAQMKLEDGVTIIEAESFEPEYSVGIVTEDGAVPMPVGEYKLEDGTILVVAVEGIIASISTEAEEEAMPEMPESPEEVVSPEMAEEAPKAKRIVESVSKETFFESQIAELKAELEALKLSVAEDAKKVEMSSQEEGAEPISFNPESQSKQEGFRFAKNKQKGILDSVFSKLS
jgi:hypothetical protein